MKRCTLGIYLLAAMAAFALPAMARAPKNHEVDPDTLRVLWADEAHQWPSFIPQALIGDLDLTSPETVDLSHLPMTEGQKASFRFFLFAEPDGPDGCFLPPISIRAPGPEEGSLSVPELLTQEAALATTATVRKIVPGWLTGVNRPAKMVFVEVNEPLRDLDSVAVPGQTLVFIQRSGAELIISGKRLCSPKSGEFEPVVDDQILLYGIGDEFESDRVAGRVFKIRRGSVYPNPQQKLLKESELVPIPLWELREKLALLPETDR